MGGEELLVVYVTAPEADGPRIAEALVAKSVAACVNVVPGVRSFYRWEKKIETSAEVLLIAKTTRSRFTALRDAVREVHPYQLPEILALPAAAVNDDYAAWVAQCVSGGPL